MLKPLFFNPKPTVTQRQKLTGFAAFILSNSVRIYAPLRASLPFLFRYLEVLRRHTKFRMPMRIATRAPPVYSDATPTTIAFIDTDTGTVYGEWNRATQAHNEALALLSAIRRYKRKRTYYTDVTVLLGLAKRSPDLLPAKTVAALINPVIRFVTSEDNKADGPSRDPETWTNRLPEIAASRFNNTHAPASSYWTIQNKRVSL